MKFRVTDTGTNISSLSHTKETIYVSSNSLTIDKAYFSSTTRWLSPVEGMAEVG